MENGLDCIPKVILISIKKIVGGFHLLFYKFKQYFATRRISCRRDCEEIPLIEWAFNLYYG
jgi:hypothetical protein